MITIESQRKYFNKFEKIIKINIVKKINKPKNECFKV